MQREKIVAIKDFANKKARVDRRLKVIFGGLCSAGLFAGGAFMLYLSLVAGGGSSAEDRAIASIIGIGCWGMALLVGYFLVRQSSAGWAKVVAEQIGVPDSVRDVEDARSTRNIPNALRGQSPPSGAVVVAGRSIWFQRIVLLVVSAVGMALLYVGTNIETILPESPILVGYIFMGAGGLLLLIGLWPNAWRARFLGFIAMPDGIYVHGQGSDPNGHEWATANTRWLFAPLSNVVDIREGRVLKSFGQSGAMWCPSTKISLRLTPEQAQTWFPYAEGEASSDALSRIVSLEYSDSDPSPEDTVSRLQQLWPGART
jgi:hypothetical protein